MQRLRRPALAQDPRSADNASRVAHRAFVDGVVAEVFASLPSAAVIDRLVEAQTAFANVNSVYDLIEHPQLRTREMPVGGRTVQVPASPWVMPWDTGRRSAPAPALAAQGAAIRAEFGDVSAPLPDRAQDPALSVR